MKHNIEAKVQEYIHKYKRESSVKEREAVAREFSNYLGGICAGQEYNEYALQFIYGIHEKPIPVQEWVEKEDWRDCV